MRTEAGELRELRSAPHATQICSSSPEEAQFIEPLKPFAGPFHRCWSLGLSCLAQGLGGAPKRAPQHPRDSRTPLGVQSPDRAERGGWGQRSCTGLAHEPAPTGGQARTSRAARLQQSRVINTPPGLCKESRAFQTRDLR